MKFTEAEVVQMAWDAGAVSGSPIGAVYSSELCMTAEELTTLVNLAAERAVVEVAKDAGWIYAPKELPPPFVDVLCRHIRHDSEYYKVMCINADGEWQGDEDLRPHGEVVTHWKHIASIAVEKARKE